MICNSLFAPHCAACDQAQSERAPLCFSCAESLWPIDVACPLCALPIEGTAHVGCRRCRLQPPPLTAVVAPFRYGGELAVAIRRMKYGRRSDLCRQLAPLVRTPLEQVAADCDLIIPVPLHWRRELVRGFNQSRTLARFALSRDTRKKLDSQCLQRTRHTCEQSGLRAPERVRNVRGAFAVAKKRRARLRGARVLLFDDVITTGATLFAAARALKAAGAVMVVGFALARAA